MHYGRLQIFKPDEPVENFFIEQDSIAIGRSTGNNLIFERNGVSRYHVSLVVQNQHLVLQDLDSVNGTYVDGIRVRANEQYLLRGGEEIQIGDVRIVFHPLSDAFQPLEKDVQVVEFDNFRVELEGPNIPITPGAHAPATINIENTGFNTEHFFIEIDGVPKEWVRLDRGDFDLLPGAQVQVGINFKPLRRPESVPGEYTITVRAYSQAKPEDVAVLKTTIQLLQFNGYGMVMGTPLIVDDQPFQIYIHNQGNGPLSLNFRGFHKGKSLKFDIRTPVVMLQAGQRETIVGTVRPARRTWFGKPRTYSYDIISHSQDAAGFQAPVSGDYMISPVFAQWVLFAGIAGILVGLVALFYMIGTALQPEPVSPQPSITRFSLSASEITFGDPVTFDWNAVRATSVRYTIERDDELILSNELSGTGGDDVSILNLPVAGEYTVTIIATNDEQKQTERTRTLRVNPSISEFIVTSSIPIYRNVQGQSVSVVWDVSGIDNTLEGTEMPIHLSGSNDFSFGDYANTTISTNIVIPATIAETIDFTLQANGMNETLATSMQTVSVVYPVCNVSATIDVYQGPLTFFDEYALLGRLPSGTSFQVNARYYPSEAEDDEFDHWVSVNIPDELGFPDPVGWIDGTQISCPSDFDYTRLVNTVEDQLPVTPRYFNPLQLGILRLSVTETIPVVERQISQATDAQSSVAIINGISSSLAREETISADTALAPGRSSVVLVAPETRFEVSLAENDQPPNLRTQLLPFASETETTYISSDIFARPAAQTEEFQPTGVFIITGRYGNPEGGSEIRLEESPNIRFKSRGQCMAGEYLTPEVVAFTCYGEDTVCEIQTEQTLSVPGRYTLVDVATGAILASSESIPYNIALRHYNDIFTLFNEDQAAALTVCIQPLVDRDADGVADTQDECPDVAFGTGADCIVYPEGDDEDS